MLSPYSFSTSISISICSFQIFFESSTLTLTAPFSSFRQVTPMTSFFYSILCLEILNNSRSSRHKTFYFTTSHAFWSIAVYTTLLASFVFALQYFFLSSSFPLCFWILNNSLFLHTVISTSSMPGFAFSITRLHSQDLITLFPNHTNLPYHHICC